MKDRYYCRCGNNGYISELKISFEIEMFHPKNKNLYLSDDNYEKKAYKTRFKRCPKCKRYLFGDNRVISAIKRDEFVNIWLNENGR